MLKIILIFFLITSIIAENYILECGKYGCIETKYYDIFLSENLCEIDLYPVKIQIDTDNHNIYLLTKTGIIKESDRIQKDQIHIQINS